MSKLGPDDRPGFKLVEVVQGYNIWAPTYDTQMNPLIMLEEGVSLNLIGDVQGLHVLDLGCGTGRYCELLSNRGANVVGIDPSENMLLEARRKVEGNSQIDILQGTIEQLEFPSRCFDLVVAALVLGHLQELEPTLTEVSRVLKDEGRLIISDIHPYWPISGHDYVEFFDKAGQEFRLPEYPHIIDDYWQLMTQLNIRIDMIREPKIGANLIEKIPSLEGYEGIPLSLVISARKESPH